MRVINAVFYSGKSCVVFVDSDDEYFVGKDVEILDDDKIILRTSITSIDKKGKRPLRGLHLRDVPNGLIKQNMTIQKKSPV